MTGKEHGEIIKPGGKTGIHRKKGFYLPLFHVPGHIIFWCTLLVTMLYDLFITNITILGREHLIQPARGAFLISNHTLYFDPGIIAHVIAPHRTCFTALEETFKVKGLGTYIRYLGAFPISKTMPFPVLMTNIRNIFRKKRFIHFFPEGELTHLNPGINTFKRGVFVFAFLFNKPVIPITIVPQPRHSLSRTLNKFFCKVTVKIGKPIYPSQFKIKGKSVKQRVKLMADYCRDSMIEDLERPQPEQAVSF